MDEQTTNEYVRTSQSSHTVTQEYTNTRVESHMESDVQTTEKQSDNPIRFSTPSLISVSPADIEYPEIVRHDPEQDVQCPTRPPRSRHSSYGANYNSGYDTDTGPAVVIMEDDRRRRSRSGTHTVRSRRETYLSGTDGEMEFEESAVMVAENSIEAARISNNYKFGLRKWKSHVTSRPLFTRSEIVQDLYADIDTVKEVKVSTVRPFNVLYTVLIGWWLALLYLVVGLFMFLTCIGHRYGKFCWQMADYFFWPFGKYVYWIHRRPNNASENGTSTLNSRMRQPSQQDLYYDHYQKGMEDSARPRDGETVTLLGSDNYDAVSINSKCWGFWERPSSYVWMVFGLLPLAIVHSILFMIGWFFVITMPTAKINSKMATKILFLPPDEVHIGDSGRSFEGSSEVSEIIMYSHQSVNVYYYKYTIDGVNIILANLLVFVILSIIGGYLFDDSVISGTTKCILSVLAIIPLTYYIGMAITSISAQSSFAVGAILNATFGSMVEVILFIIMLKKGYDSEQECYQELVKSSLTGAILCSILFIPGMSMVIGGLKYRTQRFNPRSAGISASLLFVAIIGVFAPTIFSKIFGSLRCTGCEPTWNTIPLQGTGDSSFFPVSNATNNTNDYAGFVCKECEQSLHGPHGDITLYNKHIKPMVYAICFILPVAYIIGLVFSMKTHSAHVFGEFERQLREENAGQGGHGNAQWSKIKSTAILLLCAIAIALCSDLISENIQPLLESTGISEYFIGVTMLSLVAELPEVVNGVQFALQNNVNLGIEIGCSTAIQVCLVQIPLLVLVNIIYPMGFFMVFNDVHLWTVIFSVVIINYIFQDGKSDYFQGSIVVFIYMLLMIMYFFMITPEHALCKKPS